MMLLLIVVAIAAFVYYYIRAINYWSRNGVPQGSIKETINELLVFFLSTRNFAENVEIWYKTYSNSRYVGLYSTTDPILMINDPDLIKEITVKSFDHFVDHPDFVPDTTEPLWSRNLFALKGQKWRDMRSILSPSFTSSKMRTIFLLISECAQTYTNFYSKKDDNIIEVELKDSFSRFTNDVIGTAAFGVKTNSLENPNNQFYEMGKKLFYFGSGLAAFKFFFIIAFPKISAALKIRFFRKDVSDFFVDIIEDTIRVRKEKGIVRPDMIHLLIEAQKDLENNEVFVEDTSYSPQTEHDQGKGVRKELTNLDIEAQAFIFFFAGFESVAATMCFMGYEIAKNQDIQKRLREEIEETFESCGGQLTYEALLQMKYMDMVVSETLRKWPPAAASDRECSKDYTIEPKLPGEKPVTIKAKQGLWIPIYGIQRDPNFFPDPDKFDPERFSDENKDKIKPYTYIPFGTGPRICIGSRFALLEVKTVFFYILKEFELVPIAKSQIPLKLSKRVSFNLTAEGGFWFGFKKLNK